MLYFILTLMAIGAIIGLVFSRSGEESESAWKGAKGGLKLGCGCITILILLFLLFAVLVFGGAITKVSPAQLPSPEILEHVQNI